MALVLTPFPEVDTLSTVATRGNSTSANIGSTSSTVLNLATNGNTGTWIGAIQDGTSGWSLSGATIGFKSDNTTYAAIGIGTGNGLLYFGRTTASGVGTMSSWLEVDSAGVANFKRARPQYNGSNVALASELGTTTNSVTFTSSGGAAAGTTFNGSTARTIDYSTVGAAASSHTHSYLPLSGGTLTGNVAYGTTGLGLEWSMNTDGAYIKFYNTGDADTNSRLEYGTSDNGDEFHRWMISSTEKMNLKNDALNVTVGKISVGTTSTYMIRNATTGALEFYV